MYSQACNLNAIEIEMYFDLWKAMNEIWNSSKAFERLGLSQ